ncbi:MAG: ATP synthase F1 subunit epsilon [Thermodesulfobacteriota bacterium]
MADNFLLEITTPVCLVLSDEVEMVTAPGTEGEFGVLAGHTDFLTTLSAGVLRYKKDGKDVFMAVSRGYAEVAPDKTTILVASAQLSADINVEEARQMLKEAEDAIAGNKDDQTGLNEAKEKLELAEALISTSEKPH